MFALYSPIIGNMSIAEQPIFQVPSGMGSDSELCLRNRQFASSHGYLHELSDGHIPSVIFGRDDMADMEISIRNRIGGFAPMNNGRGASKKFTPRRSDRGCVPIGSGKNWIAATAPMRC